MLSVKKNWLETKIVDNAKNRIELLRIDENNSHQYRPMSFEIAC